MNAGRLEWRDATLLRARLLTASARSLTLWVPGWQGNDAGQHVDVRLSAPDGYQAVRSYSIASAGRGEQIELAIDRLPDGEVSPFLVEQLEIGDPLELRGPLGGWFVWRPSNARPVQLVAGGSGVVPLIAMARAHRATASSAPMKLLYSLRGPDDAFFKAELSDESSSVDTTWQYTRHVPDGWSRTAGRLTEDDLAKLTFAPDRNPQIFICGPTGFVEAVSGALVAVGHSASNIRTERFGGA